MKKLLLTLTITPYLVFSQSIIIKDAQDNLRDYNSLHAFQSNGDRIDLFVPEYYSPSSTNYIREYDQNGNQLFGCDFNLSGFNYSKHPFDLIVHEDDSYTFGIVHEGAELSVLLFHHSSNNQILWKKQLTIPLYSYQYNSFYHNSLSTDGQGGIYLQIADFEFYGLVHLNSSGNLLWSKMITGPTASGKSPGFTSRPDGEGGIIGTLKDQNDESLFRIDANGNVVWSKTITDYQYRWPSNVVVLENGNIAIAGTYYDFSDGHSNPYIHIYSATGTLLQSKRYNIDMNYAYDLLEDQNGDLILLNSDMYSSATIFKINGSNLAIIEQVNFPGIYLSEESELNKTGNDQYFFNGRSIYTNDHVFNHFGASIGQLCNSTTTSIFSFEDSEFQNASVNGTHVTLNNLPLTINDISILMLPTEVEFNIEDFCLTNSLSTDETNNSVDVYPNPARDYVIIEITENEIISVFQLVDLQGKVVLTKSFTDAPSKATIDLSQIQAGTYLIGILSGEEIYYKRIIKE